LGQDIGLRRCRHGRLFLYHERVSRESDSKQAGTGNLGRIPLWVKQSEAGCMASISNARASMKNDCRPPTHGAGSPIAIRDASRLTRAPHGNGVLAPRYPLTGIGPRVHSPVGPKPEAHKRLCPPSAYAHYDELYLVRFSSE
jgi:hypothetical protein